MQSRRLEGFWGSMVHGSVSLFKHTIPVAAAAATGGASAAVVAGAGQAASLAKGTPKAGAADPEASAQGANILAGMSSSQLAVGGLSIAALMAVLARR